MPDPVVLLGLGFSTQRLARRLRQRGVPVYASVRRAKRFAEFAALGVKLCPLAADELPKNAVLVHSVPPLVGAEKADIRALIRGVAPRRILYISSTGVYGAQTDVSEATPAAPNDDKGRARMEEEEWISSPQAGWSSLILRSAAIYGPGRGLHVRLREGTLPEALKRGAGGIVSRIHVDDLAAVLEAGIGRQLDGAWPVADENPASSEEVAAWCASRMELSLPDSLGNDVSKPGRRVDGRKIRELLRVELKYPSYRTGIAASLREEAENLAAGAHH